MNKLVCAVRISFMMFEKHICTHYFNITGLDRGVIWQEEVRSEWTGTCLREIGRRR